LTIPGTLRIASLCHVTETATGELVGVGSFGQVFGGVLVKTGRRIAVKEVSLSGPHHEAGLEQARALQVEIQILSTLDHPNIIKYLGGELREEEEARQGTRKRHERGVSDHCHSKTHTRRIIINA
jgi:serine/threonine protein kinase